MLFDIDLLSSCSRRSSIFEGPEREDLLLLKVIAETGLWYGLPISQWHTFEDSPYSHIYKCFSGYCQRKAFYEGEYQKTNELTYFKCNHAPHINKIRDTATELGSGDPFQVLEFCSKQQW